MFMWNLWKEPHTDIWKMLGVPIVIVRIIHAQQELRGGIGIIRQHFIQYIRTCLNHYGMSFLRGLVFVSKDYIIRHENLSIYDSISYVTKAQRGSICYKSRYGYDKPCDDCPMEAVSERKLSVFERYDMYGEIIFQSTLRPVYGRLGDFNGLIVKMEDITDRERNKKEIIKSKEDAEKANKLKSLFLANMSHEIRTVSYTRLAQVVKENLIKELVKKEITSFLYPFCL